jgi:hypothetical protein
VTVRRRMEESGRSYSAHTWTTNMVRTTT